MARSKAGLAETGIGQDERSALLGTGLQNGETAMETEGPIDDADPTQQLLLSLDQFQKAVKGARNRSDTLWSDECMNQLILGVELSLSHGWPHLVDAFTGAGRILQTYENADRVYDALPFLENSYDILRVVATEVTAGRAQPNALDQWQAHFNGAVKDVLESGLKLVDDSVEDTAASSGTDEASSELAPFQAYNIEAEPLELKRGDDAELTTLDELPPLTSMISTDNPIPDAGEGPEDTDADELAEEVINAAQDRADTVAPAADVPTDEPPAPSQTAEPSRTVVNIVDRICDELAELKERTPEDRILALEMIEGGIGALLREAKQSGFETSVEICNAMGRACHCMPGGADEVDERFTEICFGFCGVFVEAMSDPESENVADWMAECEDLIQEWSADSVADAATETPEEAQAGMESETPPPADAEPIEITDGPGQESAAETMPAETHLEAAPPQRAESQALFEMAQRALSSGDTEAAKTYALRAAASIAEDEVSSSETLLAESETRLKLSLNSTADARSGVTETEKLVKSASSHVAAGKRTLGEAKERTAAMAQAVVDAEESVAELEAQIAELQAKRDQCLELTTTATERLNEARGSESSVSERLDGQRAAEVEARKNLESSRQHVKDLHRGTTEIETAMEKARDTLTQHKISLEDIRQTINQPSTDAPPNVAEEELLF